MFVVHACAPWQVSDWPILAICSMPEAQFAVAWKRPAVQLLKLVWSPGNDGAR